jgi:predicted phage gp36 major capsid-like protein
MLKDMAGEGFQKSSAAGAKSVAGVDTVTARASKEDRALLSRKDTSARERRAQSSSGFKTERGVTPLQSFSAGVGTAGGFAHGSALGLFKVNLSHSPSSRARLVNCRFDMKS